MDMPDKDQPADPEGQACFAPIEFGALSGWDEDDHLTAFDAFCRSASQMLKRPYSPRGSLVELESLLECAKRALAKDTSTQADAKSFFEDNFAPHVLGAINQFNGFLTGYFEPELPASRTQSAKYSIPLYRPPPDLLDRADNVRPLHLDRGAIQSGVLTGLGLELVWLKDKTDAYFVHVQGSARLVLEDEQVMRIAFAAKSGHAYTSLGKVLCDRLNIAPADMTADRLVVWMRQHPDEIDDLMALNRSYIFFQEASHLDTDDGPVGAAEIPLVAGRSLAVDQTLHPYGAPVWLSTPNPILPDDTRTNRLMIAHDTGSAIIGQQCGDIYIGSGQAAGLIAGRIQSPARLVILVPTP